MYFPGSGSFQMVCEIFAKGIFKLWKLLNEKTILHWQLKGHLFRSCNKCQTSRKQKLLFITNYFPHFDKGQCRNVKAPC